MKIQLVFCAAMGVFTTACAAPPEFVKPQRDMTTIKSAAGDITMLHTLIDMNGAHSVETLSFFKRSTSGPAQHIAFERGGSYEPALTVRRGADCAMTGVRVLRGERQLRVVHAARGGDWFDKKPFTYTVFELAGNDGGMSGTPSWYFVEKAKVVSKTARCDADEALDGDAALYRAGLK